MRVLVSLQPFLPRERAHLPAALQLGVAKQLRSAPGVGADCGVCRFGVTPWKESMRAPSPFLPALGPPRPEAEMAPETELHLRRAEPSTGRAHASLACWVQENYVCLVEVLMFEGHMTSSLLACPHCSLIRTIHVLWLVTVQGPKARRGKGAE